MTSAPRLTLLTDPVPTGVYLATEAIKRCGRGLREAVLPQPSFMRSPYRGHFAVTRSLVEGLRSLRAPFNYNPSKLNDVAETVLVLSGVSALRQALDWKRRGLIRRLLAGPNVVDFPTDHGALICAPEVDLCVTPSPMTKDVYLADAPGLAGRCESWPAGVDAAFWSPLAGSGRGTVVIYDKPTQGPIASAGPYETWLREEGWGTERIVYGRYSRESYLGALRRAALLVGFTAAESQGLAWAEAWSVDVPTLLWRKDRHAFAHPRKGLLAARTSPAPYLTPSTGALFSDLEGFKALFRSWRAGTSVFSPRAWVLSNMTDEVCAMRLWNLAGLGEGA